MNDAPTISELYDTLIDARDDDAYMVRYEVERASGEMTSGDILMFGDSKDDVTKTFEKLTGDDVRLKSMKREISQRAPAQD